MTWAQIYIISVVLLTVFSLGVQINRAENGIDYLSTLIVVIYMTGISVWLLCKAYF